MGLGAIRTRILDLSGTAICYGVSSDGVPQQIHGTGGRSQGGDAGFSAAGARAPGPMKLRGTTGAGHSVPGVLALVGGDEFNPGNEEQDRMLAEAAKPGPAFVEIGRAHV